MVYVVVVIVLLVLTFGLTVFFGPPYLPTLDPQVKIALDLLNLKPGQILLELGAGDGRVMKAAASRGLKVVGIELNPILVTVAWLRTRRYRSQVRIIWGSYWQVRWPDADGIFTFMIQRQMPELNRRIENWHRKPTLLASFAFKIPNKQPVASKKGVHLYDYR